MIEEITMNRVEIMNNINKRVSDINLHFKFRIIKSKVQCKIILFYVRINFRFDFPRE